MQAWEGGSRGGRRWAEDPPLPLSLQISTQARLPSCRSLPSAFPHRRPELAQSARGQAVGKPRARACVLRAGGRFRFSLSSQSSCFSVPAGFPESTWCGSSQQLPPPLRAAAAPLAASTVRAARRVLFKNVWARDPPP